MNIYKQLKRQLFGCGSMPRTCFSQRLEKDMCLWRKERESVGEERVIDEGNGKETERFLDPSSPEHLGKSVVLIE